MQYFLHHTTKSPCSVGPRVSVLVKIKLDIEKLFGPETKSFFLPFLFRCSNFGRVCSIDHQPSLTSNNTGDENDR